MPRWTCPIGIYHPVKGRDLEPDNACYNALLTALRAIGERGNAILKTRWRALERVTICLQRNGAIVAAAIILYTLERGRY